MGSANITRSRPRGDHDLHRRPDPSGPFRPVRTLAELRTLDEGEILDGYLCGVHGETYPSGKQSRAYWHGWRHGLMDRGVLAPDEAARALQVEADRDRRASA